MIISAEILNLPPSLFMGGIGKHMAEEQVADHDVSQIQGSNALGKSCMAAVGIERAAAGGNFAGPGVAAFAFLPAFFIGADNLTERSDLCRAGGKFLEGIVEDGDANFC